MFDTAEYDGVLNFWQTDPWELLTTVHIKEQGEYPLATGPFENEMTVGTNESVNVRSLNDELIRGHGSFGVSVFSVAYPEDGSELCAGCGDGGHLIFDTNLR